MWWKANEKEFPMLALFMKSNGAFQATTLASERLFNKDKLLFGQTRKSFTEDRASGIIFLHDYITKRVESRSYELCSQCPNPPHHLANYKLTCPKHNKK
jgi:hypothetical protein